MQGTMPQITAGGTLHGSAIYNVRLHMNYTSDWREDGPGVVVITPGGIGAMRLLGLLFGAPGAWLLYQFVDGVLHPDTMTIFGWVMLPVMAAVFVVPGWIILFGRKRTRIDITRREATEELD